MCSFSVVAEKRRVARNLTDWSKMISPHTVVASGVVKGFARTGAVVGTVALEGLFSRGCINFLST